MREKLTIAIVGNDLAAWMATAFMASQACFGPGQVAIFTGVRGCDYARIQSTLPDFDRYLAMIQAPAETLVAHGAAEHTLGCRYRMPGEEFWHIWGEYGATLGAVEFHQLLIRLLKENETVHYHELSVAAALAKQQKFKKPSNQAGSIFSTYQSAVALKSDAFVGILKKICQSKGVAINQNTVIAITHNSDKSISIDTEGGSVQGYGLVINTSGNFIDKDRGYESWQAYMPFNRVNISHEDPPSRSVVQTVCFEKSRQWSKQAQAGDLSETIVFHRDSSAQTTTEGLKIGAISRSSRSGLVHMGKSAVDFPSPVVSEADLIWITLRQLWKYFPHAHTHESMGAFFNQSIMEYMSNLRDISQRVMLLAGEKVPDFWGDGAKLPVSEQSKYKHQLFTHRGRIAVYEYEYIKPLWQIWLYLGLGAKPSSVDPLVLGLSREEMNTIISAAKRAVKRESGRK